MIDLLGSPFGRAKQIIYRNIENTPEGFLGGETFYFAYSTALVSRMTLTLI